MNNVLFACSLVIASALSSLFNWNSSGQSISQAKASVAPSTVQLQFQNNSWLPGKFTLKIQSAEEKAYGVVSFSLFSFGNYKSDFAAGSSIYLITEEEQEALMQGGEASGKLLIQIKPTDQGKTVKLIP